MLLKYFNTEARIMKLEEIEKPGELEPSTTEYKERLNHDEPVGWLKTIAGFANADGGVFLYWSGRQNTLHGCLQADRLYAAR